MSTVDASNRERDRVVSGGSMTKEDLALQITRAMHKGDGSCKNFNAYQCSKGYFLDLEIEDLIGIASQYGIKVGASEFI